MTLLNVLKADFYKFNRYQLLLISVLLPFLISAIFYSEMYYHYSYYSYTGYNMQKYFLYNVFSVFSFVYVAFVVFLIFMIYSIDYRNGIVEIFRAQEKKMFFFYFAKYLITLIYSLISLVSLYVFVKISILSMGYLMPNLQIFDYDMGKDILFFILKLFLIIQPIILLQYAIEMISKNVIISMGLPIFSTFFGFLIINNTKYANVFLYDYSFRVLAEFELGSYDFFSAYLQNASIYYVTLVLTLFIAIKFFKFKYI